MNILTGAITTAFSILLASSGSSDTIVIAADEWCPYNCEPGSNNPGFMIEVAREALEPYGHEIEYKTLNWARSLHQAKIGDINGVVGAVVDEAPNFVFGPAIGTYHDTVTFRKGEGFDPDEMMEHPNLRLGAINGYEYYGAVNDFIEGHQDDRQRVQFVSGEDALEKNIRKLIAGRIDAIAEVRSVMDYNLALFDLTTSVEIREIDEENDIFIAFSPSLSESQIYADQLSEGVELLKSTGRYAEIFAKYGVEPK
ncbi:MAG: polar amino acid transport system substrate-binding protein [Yoonia sp.]